jgi:general secretion pathway protein G
VGHTFVELLVTMGILAILATAVLPVAAMSRRREKEIELRHALRDIRAALDMYHELCTRRTLGGGGGQQAPAPIIQMGPPEDDPGMTCWPSDLDVLVHGVKTNIPDYKLRFIRRIPVDPFNRSGEEHDQHGWVLRSSNSDPERSLGWDRTNVFDVRSGSESQALDNSYYGDW